MARKNGTSCTKVLLFVFNALLWVSNDFSIRIAKKTKFWAFDSFWQIVGLGILAVGLWMLEDPRRAYVLDLVNYYENDPLLLFAAYIFIGVGSVAVIVGILGCCGALREIQCMLASVSFLSKKFETQFFHQILFFSTVSYSESSSSLR